jgi:hypothetical protein
MVLVPVPMIPELPAARRPGAPVKKRYRLARVELNRRRAPGAVEHLRHTHD